MTQEPTFRDNLLNLFQTWDTNQSGSIEESELCNALESFGMQAADVQEILRLADAGRAGRVNYAEFCEWLTQAAPTHVLQAADIHPARGAVASPKPPKDEDRILTVTVSTITGSVIVSNFQLSFKDTVKDLIAEVVRCKPPEELGYTYQLCIGQGVLEEHNRIENTDLFDGAEVTAILQALPAVRSMLAKLKKTVSFMNTNPEYFGGFDEDEGEERPEDEKEDEDETEADISLQASLLTHEEVLPSYTRAIALLEELDMKDLSGVKAFARPPACVHTVVTCVRLLLNVEDKGHKNKWSDVKTILCGWAFMRSLCDYDRRNIKIRHMAKVRALLREEPLLTNDGCEQMRNVSKAGYALTKWVLAIEEMVMSIAPPEALEVLRQREDAAQKQAEAAGADDDDIPNYGDDEWNEEYSWRSPLNMLKRLGHRAAAATPYFATLLQKKNIMLKELGAWCLGMVGSAAGPHLSELFEGTQHANQKVKAVSSGSLVLLGKTCSFKISDANLLKKMILDEVQQCLHTDRWTSITEQLMLYLLRSLPEAELDCIFPQVMNSPNKKVVTRGLISQVARRHPAYFRRTTRPDFFDEKLWQQSLASLDKRLSEAKEKQEAKRQEQYEKFARTCNGDEELKALDKMWHASSVEIKLHGIDPDQLPFRGWVAGFDPMQLRAKMHADPLAYDPIVVGEAGWRCLEMCVIEADKFAPGQNEFTGKLSPNAQLRRMLTLKARLVSKSSKYCVAKLANAEGGDPLHSWLFPDKSRSPDESVELPAVSSREQPFWFNRHLSNLSAYENMWLPFELEDKRFWQDSDAEEEEDEEGHSDENLPPIQDCSKLLMRRVYPPFMQCEEEE